MLQDIKKIKTVKDLDKWLDTLHPSYFTNGLELPIHYPVSQTDLNRMSKLESTKYLIGNMWGELYAKHKF